MDTMAGHEKYGKIYTGKKVCVIPILVGSEPQILKMQARQNE